METQWRTRTRGTITSTHSGRASASSPKCQSWRRPSSPCVQLSLSLSLSLSLFVTICLWLCVSRSLLVCLSLCLCLFVSFSVFHFACASLCVPRLLSLTTLSAFAVTTLQEDNEEEEAADAEMIRPSALDGYFQFFQIPKTLERYRILSEALVRVCGVVCVCVCVCFCWLLFASVCCRLLLFVVLFLLELGCLRLALNFPSPPHTHAHAHPPTHTHTAHIYFTVTRRCMRRRGWPSCKS